MKANERPQAHRRPPSSGSVLRLRQEPQARFFLLRLRQSLPEDLDFHRLAAEHPLKLTDALFEPADLRAPDNWFIRSHRCSSALGHQPAPTIQQVGSNAAPSRNR